MYTYDFVKKGLTLASVQSIISGAKYNLATYNFQQRVGKDGYVVTTRTDDAVVLRMRPRA
jgi:hypothetical protein